MKEHGQQESPVQMNDQVADRAPDPLGPGVKREQLHPPPRRSRGLEGAPESFPNSLEESGRLGDYFGERYARLLRGPNTARRNSRIQALFTEFATSVAGSDEGARRLLDVLNILHRQVEFRKQDSS